MTRLLEYLGKRGFFFLYQLGGTAYLLRDTTYFLMIAPFRRRVISRRATAVEMVNVGVATIPVVLIVLLFIGMTLAFQMAYILEKYGMILYVPRIVAVALVRELGPLMTAIVMTAGVGAAMTSELGGMKVNEEILALETSALNPVRFLVAPRFLAALVMIPTLTVLANYVGIIGGLVIGTWLLDIDPNLYIRLSHESLKYRDIFTGMTKAVAFAVVITLIACYKGITVTGGSVGVGKATRDAVKYSIVMIIATDCFFTALFYFV